MIARMIRLPAALANPSPQRQRHHPLIGQLPLGPPTGRLLQLEKRCVPVHLHLPSRHGGEHSEETLALKVLVAVRDEHGVAAVPAAVRIEANPDRSTGDRGQERAEVMPLLRVKHEVIGRPAQPTPASPPLLIETVAAVHDPRQR